MKQSTRKTLINKILTRLLRLELKSKAIKFIVKKVMPDCK